MLPTHYAEVFGDWLSGYEWSHWGTFTFRPYAPRPKPGLAPPRLRSVPPGPSVEFAHREWRRYVRRLERTLYQRIWWFRGDEFGEQLGRLHFHALLGGAPGVEAELLAKPWTAGFAQVEEYDPNRGAAHYVTKYVRTNFGDWDLSRWLVEREPAS